MHIGLNCYNEYAEKCFKDSTSLLPIENEVNSAKNFYSFLCIDKDFKKNYLRHAKCLEFAKKVKFLIFMLQLKHYY